MTQDGRGKLQTGPLWQLVLDRLEAPTQHAEIRIAHSGYCGNSRGATMRRLPRGLPVGMEANVMIQTWSPIDRAGGR